MHAFDRDAERLKILEARVAAAGAQDVVTARHGDFLAAEPVAGEEPRTAWLAFWAEIHYSSIVPMGEAVAEAPG